MSATTMVWNGKRATTRTLVQYSDAAVADTTTSTMTTEHEASAPMQHTLRQVLHSSWVMTPEGLRLHWAVGE